MKKLEFENNIYHKGINLTIRRGVSWALEKSAYMPKFGIIPIHTIVIRFCDICEDKLVNHHDPYCQEFINAFDRMCDLYENFRPEEIVTLVFFEMNSSSALI